MSAVPRTTFKVVVEHDAQFNHLLAARRAMQEDGVCIMDALRVCCPSHDIPNRTYRSRAKHCTLARLCACKCVGGYFLKPFLIWTLQCTETGWISPPFILCRLERFAIEPSAEPILQLQKVTF